MTVCPPTSSTQKRDPAPENRSGDCGGRGKQCQLDRDDDGHEHRGEADRFEQTEFSGPIEDPGADQGGQDEPDGEQQRDGEGAQHDRGGVVPLGCVGEATVTYL